MRVGVLGLGHIGFPIANLMHSLGHEVHSWTRSEKSVPWKNHLKIDPAGDIRFDFFFIASGCAKPDFGNFETEFDSTIKLISNFNFSKKSKIVYISSGAVYGECDEPMSELVHPYATTEYGSAKLLTEIELERRYGNQLTVLRVGNIIDQENPYGIVSHLTQSIQRGVFEVFGEATDCRDYFVVDDFLSCIQSLIEIEHLPKVLNIGSGRSVSLAEISQILTTSLGDQIKIVWGTRRPGDVSQTMLDVSLMRQKLKKTNQDPIKKLESLMNNLT
jgi:nucleoside-diphosphate-sugar epimerase